MHRLCQLLLVNIINNIYASIYYTLWSCKKIRHFYVDSNNHSRSDDQMVQLMSNVKTRREIGRVPGELNEIQRGGFSCQEIEALVKPILEIARTRRRKPLTGHINVYGFSSFSTIFIYIYINIYKYRGYVSKQTTINKSCGI